MTNWSETTRFLILLLTVAGLAACSSTPPQQNTGSGRYQMASDSPELEPIDFATVKKVVPEPVNRTLAGNKSPYTVNGKSYFVMSTEAGYEETGMASWYGRKFHGHLTSNGEIYDMFSFSAAHKTLPIPSFLEVTNLANGKSLVVRVNDRGPFHDGRIVDLSYAAAAYLEYAANGTARVRVRALLPEGPGSLSPLPPSPTEELDQVEVLSERELIEQDAGQEYLQVGAFSNYDSASRLRERVQALTSLPAFIRSDAGSAPGATLHRVRVGPVNETMDIQQLIAMLSDAGLGTPFRVRQ